MFRYGPGRGTRKGNSIVFLCVFLKLMLPNRTELIMSDLVVNL